MISPRLNRLGTMRSCVQKDQSLVVVPHLDVYEAEVQEIACLKI